MTETASLSYLIESSFPETGSVNLIQLRSLLLALTNCLQLQNTGLEYGGMDEKKEVDDSGGKDSSSSPKVVSKDEDRGVKIEVNGSDAQKFDLKSKKPTLTRNIVDQTREEYMRAKDADIEKLEKKVSEIEKKLEVIETLPSNEELISRSRKPSNTPFSDWWNTLNLSKRMDASEESSKKFASALEELSREMGKMKEGINDKSDEIDRVIKDVQQSESKTSLAEVDGKLAEALAKMDQRVAKMKNEIRDLKAQQNNILTLTDSFPLESLPDVLTDLSHLKSLVNTMETKQQSGDLEEKINEQIQENTEKIKEMSMNLINQSSTFQSQIADIEKELGMMNERLNTGGPASEGRNDEESLRELYDKLQALHEEIESLNETTTVLISGQKERESNINSLLEQVQLIKNIKADKEGLEDALAEKADAFSVNRKVSHDQFDAAYHELNRSIIDAQARLGLQEQAWISAIAEIQKDIGEKLDKIEIAPLQEVIDNKLKQLEDKVKAMSERKKDTEACGTKKKLMRNINCISCDKRVAMKTELDGPLLPTLDRVSPIRSMRPFLTYELDHIRKDLKSPYFCNAHNFANNKGDPCTKANDLQSKVQSGGHYCSRYCGGSHTMITNEQRVRRVGHFPDSGFTDENIKGIISTAEKLQNKL